MEMIDYQPLYQLRQSDDKVLRLSDINNRGHNGVVISLLIQHLLLLRDQLLDHIGKLAGKGLSYLRAGILGSHSLTDFNETVQGDLVPVLHVLFFLLHQLHFLPGIINQRGNGLFIRRAQGMSKHIVNLFSDRPGAIAQHMGKRLVLPMNIRQKMLRPFGQI